MLFYNVPGEDIFFLKQIYFVISSHKHDDLRHRYCYKYN